ncbi:MAG: 3-deoxy-manno-octulosonate cytidylyltransferase [Candidatus Sumerlaeota bacterium]|nr:3-deoxy-manno-octulosonate cytidylyltransferase [Candidatus Sumerlaeota bacterium]
MATPRIIAVIPARYASTRFPGKPLYRLAGKPMILWVIERARAVKQITAVYAATDDQRIFDAVVAGGGQAIMTSDRARSGSDRIAEAIANLEADVIVNLQGDEPLLRPETIEAAIEKLLEDAECDVSTTCVEIRTRREFENPNNVKVVMARDGQALYFSRSPIPSPARRQESDLCDGRLFGYKHQGLYIYRREALLAFSQLEAGALEEIEKLEQLRYLEHGYKIKVAVTPYDSPGVDMPEDAEEVERKLVAGK